MEVAGIVKVFSISPSIWCKANAAIVHHFRPAMCMCQDPPFGIHLCGREHCVLPQPITPVHDDRVRPYRGIPIFQRTTVVQHYLRPEEMRPFYDQVTPAYAQ